jgi:hypothetical protein
LVACALVATLAVTEARADFSGQVVIAAGTPGVKWPVGAAIRNWEATDDVFTVVEWSEDELHTLVLKHRQCSNNDECATITLVDTETVDAASGAVFVDVLDQLRYPSLAISRASGNDPIEVYVIERDKYWNDCDDDDIDYSEEDPDDLDSLGLSLSTYDTDSDAMDYKYFVAGGDWEGTTCDDHRRSFTRRRTGETHTCYERLAEFTDPDEDWFPECSIDHQGGETAASSGSPEGKEPATAFDFYSNDRFVAWSRGASQYDVAVENFDGNRTSSLESTADNEVKSPFVDYSNGADTLTVVWAERDAPFDGGLIMYSACDANCDSEVLSIWDTPTTVTTGTLPNRPQIAHDGDRELLIYENDSALIGRRIMATSRCIGGSWSTPFEVRTPSDASYDQSISNGTPNLVLNRAENIAHVVLLETGDGGVEDSVVVHAWNSYSDCP